MKLEGKILPDHLETQRPVKKILEEIKYESVLDIGCSAQMLKRVLKPKKYFGIDMLESTFGVKPDMITDLKNIKKIGLKDKSFDVVVASQVLEHIPNLERLCAEIRRISRKYIVIGLPNELVYDSRIRFTLGDAAFKSYQLIDEPWEIHYWFFNKKNADSFIFNEFEKHEWRLLKFFGDFHSSGARLLPYPIKDAMAKLRPSIFAKGLYYLLEKI